MEFPSRSRRNRTLGSFTGVVLLSAAGSVAAAVAAVPAKDSFHGRITRATGRFSSDRAMVAIALHIPRSTDGTRTLRMTLTGPACGTAPHCLALSGTLKGTISARPGTIPDVGRRYGISVSGTLDRLGHVTATGTVTGVGFIREGHEGLTLDITAARGKLTVAAVSGEVPGFTSP
jgi:hypothetical protein